MSGAKRRNVFFLDSIRFTVKDRCLHVIARNEFRNRAIIIFIVKTRVSNARAFPTVVTETFAESDGLSIKLPAFKNKSTSGEKNTVELWNIIGTRGKKFANPW